jgi:hypothetical protein
MTELLRWRTERGPVVVETGDHDALPTMRPSPDVVVHDAAGTFEDALAGVRAAAVSALATFRDDALRPDQVTIEFGVKLSAEAGAVIAKTALEGHLLVKLAWTREQGPVAGT